MTPYYEQDGIAIYHADCRDVFCHLGRVDACVTDPPYNVRQDDIPIDGRSGMRRDFGTWDQDWDAAAFLARVGAMIRPGGSLVAFTSDRLLSEFRNADGWKPRGTVVWVKPNAAPAARPGYMQTTELIVWLQKPGAAATWNATGYTPNVLTYPRCAGHERTEHPTQKPEALIAELIARHTNPGDHILDPYMGSGTTLAAAKRLGRFAIGIDVNESYCEIAARRLQQSALPLDAPAVPPATQSDLLGGL